MSDLTALEQLLAELTDTDLRPTEYEFARAVIAAATASRTTLATAESLTGGLLGALLTSVPGASEVFRGGVIAYATDIKSSLLSVDVALLERGGPVQSEVALAMAQGVSGRLTADLTVGVTGVAGPGPQNGVAPGVVHIAVFDAATGSSRLHSLTFTGDRAEIRVQTAIMAFATMLDVLVAKLGISWR